MPTQLKSHCPNCHKQVKVDDSLIGKRVRCPACKNVFVPKSVQFAPESPSLEQSPQASETFSPSSSDTSAGPEFNPFVNVSGKRLGRFELKELLGQGGFGRVYKAFDPQLKRFIALKVPTFGPDDKHRVQRFIAEAEAAANLHHPNIVPIYDSGQIDGQYFIAAKYIAGQALSGHLKQTLPDFRHTCAFTRNRLVTSLTTSDTVR